MSESRPPAHIAARSRVVAWALWDCGSTGVSAIVVTFVFSVYLTRTVGDDLPAGTSAASLLGWALFFSGVTVALLAPVIGVWVDLAHRRRRTLAVLTAMVVLLTSSMSLIRDDASYLVAGLLLLGFTAACNDLASVPYNAMLRQLTTPETSGRVSGFGWAAGYVGSMVLLLVVYAGFIGGDGPTAGLLDVPTADGQNTRAAMLVTAAWMAAFAMPVLIAAPPPADIEPPARSSTGVLGAYRKLWSDLVAEWRRDRNVVYYLLASAVFRDGLAGVFTFGAVLGVTVYGISVADVLLFGVSANVVAAAGAVIGGLLDDRVGSKAVIFELAGGDDRGGPDPDGVVRCRGVLGVRAAAVPVHRADAVVGADPAAADHRPRQGRGVVRSLHDDGPGRGAPRPVHVRHVRRRLRSGSRGHRGSTPGVGGGFHRDAWGAGATPGSGGLAGRGADGQACAGALLHLGAVDGDRAIHFTADVDDADAGGVLGRLGQLDRLAPRQHHVELGLQHTAGVDVGDVDGPTVARDVVHHGFGRARRRRAGGGRRAGQCRQGEDGEGACVTSSSVWAW